LSGGVGINADIIILCDVQNKQYVIDKAITFLDNVRLWLTVLDILSNNINDLVSKLIIRNKDYSGEEVGVFSGKFILTQKRRTFSKDTMKAKKLLQYKLKLMSYIKTTQIINLLEGSKILAHNDAPTINTSFVTRY